MFMTYFIITATVAAVLVGAIAFAYAAEASEKKTKEESTEESKELAAINNINEMMVEDGFTPPIVGETTQAEGMAQIEAYIRAIRK